MKLLNVTLLFLCVLFFTPSVFGQQKKRVKRSNSMRISFTDASVDSLEDAVMSDGFLYGGVNYMNRVATLGRDNNVKQWAIDPLVGFHKYNCEVYVNGFRWSQTTPKWAETDMGINKLWQLSKPLSLISTYEHAFIHYGTDDDKYGLNNLAALQLIWTNKIFDIDARYEYDWGRTCASNLEFSLGHEFDIYDVLIKDKIEITPRFYMTYLGGNTYPVRFFRNSPLCQQPFQKANFEIELPITWRKIGDIEWNLSFIYDIPKNVLPEEGSGKSVFYITSSFVKIIDFKTKHHQKRN
jgi:hypothetical protein